MTILVTGGMMGDLLEMTRVAKGRPKKSERHDVTLKADATIIGWAKMVAKARGISLAEYVSEVLRGQVGKDFAAEMERLKGRSG